MDFFKRLEMATNAQTSPQELAQLANDPRLEVRLAVAENPETPTSVLTQLAGDKDEWVRAAVGANPETPPEAFTQLAGDEYECVRSEVARNPRTPVEVVNRLAQEQWLREKIIESFSKRSTESLCELAAQANRALAQIMVEYHKENSLPLQVFQAGLKGKQSKVFYQELERSSSLYERHKEAEREP